MPVASIQAAFEHMRAAIVMIPLRVAEEFYIPFGQRESHRGFGG
jgi:hypothetical protein